MEKDISTVCDFIKMFDIMIEDACKGYTRSCKIKYKGKILQCLIAPENVDFRNLMQNEDFEINFSDGSEVVTNPDFKLIDEGATKV